MTSAIQPGKGTHIPKGTVLPPRQGWGSSTSKKGK